MRKNQLIYSALPIAILGGIATQAFAGENCLIDNPNLSNCKGAIQVTKEFVVNGTGPIVVDNGSNHYESAYSYSSNGAYVNQGQVSNGQILNMNEDQYSYNETSGAVYSQPAYTPPAPSTKGCKLVQQVPCQGQWVVVGGNNGQIINQNYAPPVKAYAPPMQAYAPPVQAYAPPVQAYAPPMQAYAPPVQAYAPPVQAYAPPMQAYAPPANYSVQPFAQTIYNIPTTFFTGGMNSGVGYPTMTGYNSGGGIYMAGGTRFSGVVNRSTTPLIPPSGKPKQPPPPPPTGCGGGGC